MYTVQGTNKYAEVAETVTDTIVRENNFQTLQGFWNL